jgi:hypothetical protein
MKNTSSNKINEITKKIDFDLINEIRLKKGKTVFNRTGFSILAGITLIVIIIISLWSKMLWQHPLKVFFGTFIIGAVFTALLAYILTSKTNKEYKKQLKEHLTDKIIAELGYNLEYILETKLSKEDFKRSKLIDLAYSRFKSEDLFIGEIDTTKFQFSELSIEYNYEGKAPFNGLYFRFDFDLPKDFVLDVVEQKKGRLDKINSTLKLRDGLVIIENQQLNTFYSIFSNDQSLTSLVLSDHFYLNFKKRFIDSNQTVFFSIREGLLHITLFNETDYFKINYDVEIEKQINQQISDLEFVYNSANELLLFFKPLIKDVLVNDNSI